MTCPTCGEPTLAGEQFCEGCGAPLTAQQGPGCRECGTSTFVDGYCDTCGAPAARERDHFTEQPAPWLAAVCDRGIRHHRNEDATALAATGPVGVLVVCDGVSAATDSDLASLAAARAARDVLAGAAVGGDWPALLADAADAANAEVVAVTTARNADSPPSCTFVAAVADGVTIATGCVGDSRAYWLPDDGEPAPLSVDDSWAAEQIALGMPPAEAHTARLAHAITRWLGVDTPDHRPRVSTMPVTGPGWVLVCSDGLWNYCSPATDLAALVRGFGIDDPLPLAQKLVDWANDEGGQDNITVALARLGGHRHQEA